MKLSELIEDLRDSVETLGSDVEHLEDSYQGVLDGEFPGFLKKNKELIDDIKEKVGKAIDQIENINISRVAAELDRELEDYEPDLDEDEE